MAGQHPEPALGTGPGGRAARRPRWSLRVDIPQAHSYGVEIAATRLVAGRGSAADLPLEVEGVSRAHAAFELDGDELWIEDLGSTNGTLVNGGKIGARVSLRDGDLVGIGRARLTVQLGATQEVAGWPLAGATEDPAAFASSLATIGVHSQVLGTQEDQRLFRALYLLGRALDPSAAEVAGRRRTIDVLATVFEPARACLAIDGETTWLGDDAPFELPPAVSDAVLAQGKAVLTVTGQPPRSVVAAPLPLQRSSLLYLDAPLAERRFSPADLDLLVLVAHQVAALLDNARLVAELQAASRRLAAENGELRTELRERHRFAAIKGQSGAIQEVLRVAARVAETDATVLITGESGTGKELVARAIHSGSARGDQPFVALNCAAIPENLVEAELFGIERGVATGVDRRLGRFEAAGSGTVFLDEIGELPLAVQAKLLRVLEERVVTRVGSHKTHPVRARVVAATNRDLAAEAAAGRFREDLFYRLHVVPIRIPPLRERRGDVTLLAEAFLHQAAARHRRAIRGFSPEARALLEGYSWPGNVRELQNEIERVATLWDASEGVEVAGPEHLAPHIRVARAGPEAIAEPEVGPIKDAVAAAVERLERHLIRAALSRTNDNRTQAAQLLGLTREGLRKKMARYGID